MEFISGMVVGLFVGAFIGMVTVALCVAASDREEREE